MGSRASSGQHRLPRRKQLLHHVRKGEASLDSFSTWKRCPYIYGHEQSFEEFSDSANLRFWAPAVIPGCHSDFLYPFDEICAAEELVHVDIPFQDRLNQLIWRGSSTGGGTNVTNHRIRAVRYLKTFGYDVGISNFIQGIPDQADLGGDFIDIKEWNNFKVILDIGGNSYSKRLTLLAQLKSAVIILNEYTDIFSETLENGTHVLKARTEYNIPPLVEFLIKNEDYAQAMGNNFYLHWKENFTREAVLKRMVEKQRSAYSKLFFDDRALKSALNSTLVMPCDKK